MLLLACLAIMISGCTHHDLCYHHEHLVKLRLEFDWRDAPDASPRGMLVYFYPDETESGNIYRFDFSNTSGGEIEVKPGKYHIISYNNDTELASGYDKEKFHTHYLYTREGPLLEPQSTGTGKPGRDFRDNSLPRPYGTEDERVVVSPDELWGCTAIDVEVTEQGVSYKCFPLEEKEEWIGLPPIITEHVITLYPHDLLCLYSYEVRNVKRLEKVASMSGVLTGMSPSLFLHDETLGEECITIPVEAHRLDATTIGGKFLTFGHHGEIDKPHQFALYLFLKDNKMIYAGDTDNYNVTEQIHAAPDRRRVHYIIDGSGIEIPEDPVIGGDDEGGWGSSFDDWGETIEQTITIGT